MLDYVSLRVKVIDVCGCSIKLYYMLLAVIIGDTSDLAPTCQHAK